METKNYNPDKLEFRQIVLKHIQTILEISNKELRNKTYTTNYSNHESIVEQEDTRISYIQSIENLAYILIPYFDEKVKDIYKESIRIIDGLDFEVFDYCKTEYDKICEKFDKKDVGHGFAVMLKLRYAKKLFIALNLLLNRNDYLKNSIYGEDRDELVSGDMEDSE